MPNEIQVTGDHNIVLQDISGSDVQIVVQEGLPLEVKAQRTELKAMVQALTAQLDQQLAQLPLPGCKRGRLHPQGAQNRPLCAVVGAGHCAGLDRR